MLRRMNEIQTVEEETIKDNASTCVIPAEKPSCAHMSLKYTPSTISVPSVGQEIVNNAGAAPTWVHPWICH